MITPGFLTHEGDRLFGTPGMRPVAVTGALTAVAVIVSKLALAHVEPGRPELTVSIAAGIFVMILACLTLIELCRYIVDVHALGTVKPPPLVGEINAPDPAGSKLYRSINAPTSAALATSARTKELTR